MTPRRLMYAYFRRCSHSGSFFFIFLLCSCAMPLGAQTPLPPPATPAAPAFSMPADFAPAPFALPSSRAGLQKRLSGLVRGFAPVQSAEVLLTGEPGQALSAQVLIKRRAGRELSPEALESLVRVLVEGCPGLQPARLTVVESSGKLLYSQGQAQVQNLDVPTRGGMLWLFVALLVGVGVAVAARRPWQKPAAGRPNPFDFLGSCEAGRLETLMAEERPEVVVLMARETCGAARRRMETWLQKQPVQAPQHELEEEVREALAASLRRQYQM